MAEKVFIAVDLGASSGRLVAGVLAGNQVRLEELHRFANGPVRLAGRQHWDLLGLWTHIQEGLRVAGRQYGNSIVSVGIDTWGVDYGLLGPGDELLGNPYAYRDGRTGGIFEKAFEMVSREEFFTETGLQFMEFNTAFQLLAARLTGSPLLDAAKHLLLMPDLFNWLLTGVKANEQTDSSTTQLYNPQTQTWSTTLINKLGLPAHIFGTIMPPWRVAVPPPRARSRASSRGLRRGR